MLESNKLLPTFNPFRDAGFLTLPNSRLVSMLLNWHWQSLAAQNLISTERVSMQKKRTSSCATRTVLRHAPTLQQVKLVMRRWHSMGSCRLKRALSHRLSWLNFSHPLICYQENYLSQTYCCPAVCSSASSWPPAKKIMKWKQRLLRIEMLRRFESSQAPALASAFWNFFIILSILSSSVSSVILCSAGHGWSGLVLPPYLQHRTNQKLHQTVVTILGEMLSFFQHGVWKAIRKHIQNESGHVCKK